MGQGPGTVGTQLEERYFLQKVKLGQGSFGTVWRAVDRQRQTIVAIKQLDKASLPRRGVTRQDIEREISMMKACDHDNITKLYDNFEDANSIYLALEYCDGGDFGDKVKERGHSIDELEMAEWCRQMVAAICALHSKGICHRDIKPDNFMISGEQSGDKEPKLKLSDFGLAIFLPRGKLLQEKCGTPAFMSPEQHHLPKRSPGYGFPVDIWATGVSMYMMFFGGKHPFLNDRGHLDDNLLLSGELDFRESIAYNGFFGFGQRPLRFSDDARKLCKSMVEPDPNRRVTSEDAMTSPWLLIGMGRGRGRQGGGVSSPTESGQGTEDMRNRSPTPRRAQSQDPGDGVRPPPARGRSPGSSPSPPDHRALREAAKLKEQNQNLQAELDERKRREEQLMQQKNKLEVAQERLKVQRSKELEMQNQKLIAQEKHLVRVEKEKEELEMQRRQESKGAEQDWRQSRAVAPSGASRGSKAAAATSSGGSTVRQGYLHKGLKCRYESGTYGWMSAVVQGFNESDSTYNLDVRQHAALDKVSPVAEITALEAWPPGTLASYLSTSANQWLAAVVVSFNESDGTYNLDVRDHADLDRIRARVSDRPLDGDDVLSRKGTVTGLYSTELGTVAKRNSEARLGGGAQQRESSKASGTTRGSELEAGMATGSSPTASSGQKVGRGDRCTAPEHGLVMIDSVSDGTFTVRTSSGQRLQFPAHALRAPEEKQYAWPTGTKVSYQSASLKGKWIDANVVSFNPANGTYNLDVRMEAAPDKVRPR